MPQQKVARQIEIELEMVQHALQRIRAHAMHPEARDGITRAMHILQLTIRQEKETIKSWTTPQDFGFKDYLK